MGKVFVHIRNCIFRGLLAVIPILLCIIVLQLLYILIDKQVLGFLDQFFEIRKIPGLGIALVLVSLYLVGLSITNFAGHVLLRFIESVSQKIPIIKTIYGIGKQVSLSLSAVDKGKRAFKKALLVKISDGLMVPVFVMSTWIHPATKEEYLFVLMPTAPTPASGFVMVVKADQVVDFGWTVEESLKVIVSAGIIPPGSVENPLN